MTDVYTIGELVQFCESPIEVRLIKALATVFTGLDDAGMLLDGLAPRSFNPTDNLQIGTASAYLIPQAQLESFDCVTGDDWTARADFLLVCGRRGIFRRIFAIECDGHDWHEKTKRQVARDKLRDRRMIAEGIIPLRFSGSEITRNAMDCARYIRSVAHNALGDALSDEYDWSRLRKVVKPKGFRVTTK